MFNPPNHAIAISPSDDGELGFCTEWICFVNSGTQTLTIDTPGGEKQVSITLPSGMWPIRAVKVWSTGTTVTDIVGFKL